MLVSAEFFRRDDAEEALPYAGTVSSVCRKSLSCMMKEALSHHRKARSAWLHGVCRGDVWLYQARCQSVTFPAENCVFLRFCRVFHEKRTYARLHFNISTAVLHISRTTASGME